jgi:hypothetical protein
VLASLLLASCSTGGANAGAGMPSSGTSPPSAPNGTSLPVTRSWKLGPIADLAVGPNAVYALYSPATSEGALPNATDTRLARIDRTTGAVMTAGPFPFAWHIAAAAGAVWIGPNNQYSGTSAPDSRTLVSVDAQSLATQQRVVLPAEVAPGQLLANIATDSGSVWVAYGSHLYRLAAASGAIVASRSLAGTASSIALDPAGRRLYVGVTDDAAATGAAIAEFEPATLKSLVSTSTGGGGLGGPQVAAGVDDVWVSYATGMLGQVEHRQASNLAVTPVAPLRFSNGVHVFEAGNLVWVVDAMAGRLVCLDPRTGAVRVDWGTAQGGVLAGDGSAMYLGDVTGVGAFQPDPRCR